jgi:hypothetical protein
MITYFIILYILMITVFENYRPNALMFSSRNDQKAKKVFIM